MKFFALALGLAVADFALAQGVTEKIAPEEAAPDGCKPIFDGLFQVTVQEVTTIKGGSKRVVRDTKKTQACAADGTLVVGLAGGVLTDAKDRTGYIASNRQFQFDGPPQAGAIFTAGFSVCGNNSLALGGSTVFWQCASGSFYNLYDRHWAPQCSPVEIVALPCSNADSAPPVQQIPDGQVVGTSIVATTVVVPLSDGQPQVITTTIGIPLCQIDDGQVQQKTVPCASITPVAPKPSTVPAPVSQFSDGQIQVTPLPGTSPAPPPATATPTGPAPPPPSPPPPASTAPPKPTGSAPGGGVNTTLSSATPTVPVQPPPSGSPPPSSPPVNGAGSLQMSSVGALVVGLVGALWCL